MTLWQGCLSSQANEMHPVTVAEHMGVRLPAPRALDNQHLLAVESNCEGDYPATSADAADSGSRVPVDTAPTALPGENQPQDPQSTRVSKASEDWQQNVSTAEPTERVTAGCRETGNNVQVQVRTAPPHSHGNDVKFFSSLHD